MQRRSGRRRVSYCVRKFNKFYSYSPQLITVIIRCSVQLHTFLYEACFNQVEFLRKFARGWSQMFQDSRQMQICSQLLVQLYSTCRPSEGPVACRILEPRFWKGCRQMASAETGQNSERLGRRQVRSKIDEETLESGDSRCS